MKVFPVAFISVFIWDIDPSNNAYNCDILALHPFMGNKLVNNIAL